MPKVEITLPQLHEAQHLIKSERKRFNVMNCGRRFGKNVLEHDFAIEVALQGLPVGWFSPTYKMMLDDWRTLINTLHPITRRSNITERRIELVTDGMIEFWSVDNTDVGRGRKYKRVIINEAAMIPRLRDAWEHAIRPTLTDLKGDAYFDSTPKGRNYYFELYQRGLTNDDWACWTMPTSANPYIDAAEIEAAREQLPELTFEQEYLAVFLEGAGAVFRNIAACMNAPATTPEEHEGHDIVAGVDWGKQADFTAISVGCATCRQEVAHDRFNKIDYHFQRGRLKAIAEQWNVSMITAESNAMGEPVIEELHREGLPVKGFQTTAQTKPPLIENLALTLERVEWQFLQDQIWTGELEAYERKVSPVTGRSQYSAPEGLHDDTVIARALMLNGTQEWFFT
jgi:hypothetical protein